MRDCSCSTNSCPVTRFLFTNYSMGFGVLLLRIGIGLMMLLAHGIPKIQMLCSGQWDQFPDPIGIGCFLSLALSTFAEAICSVLLILGLFTRAAAVILVINMSVALFLVLGLSGWGMQETAALYLLVYLALFYTGAGRFSLDHLLERKLASCEA